MAAPSSPSAPTSSADRRLSAGGLRDVLAVVNSSRGLDEILTYLVVQAQEVLGSEGVGLYLRDEHNPDILVVQAAHGVAPELVSLTAPIGYPVIGLAVSRCRSVVVSDFGAALQRPTVATVDEQIEDRGTYLEVLSPGPQSYDQAQRDHNRRLSGIYPTIAAVPLLAHGIAYGSLALYYRTANAYGAEQVDLSEAFAQQAALAIENARLRGQAEQRLMEIERRQRVAEALRDLLAVVNSSHNLDQILDEVLGQSSQLLGNDASAVYLLDDEAEDVLRVRATQGLQPGDLAEQIRVGAPTTGLAVQQARTLVCFDLSAALPVEPFSGEPRSPVDEDETSTVLEDLGTFGRVVRLPARPEHEPDDRYSSSRVRGLTERFRAVMSTPLVARGRVFGAITLFYASPRTFSSEEVDLGRAFAQQATLAIENARLHVEAAQRMRENERRRQVAEGMRDLLASVNSTRSLDEVLDLVLEQSAQLLGSDAGSILLLDGNKAGAQGVLRVRASRALVSDLVPTRLPVGTAITGVAVERGRPVAVFDLLAATPLPGVREAVIEERPGYLQIQRIADPPPEVVDIDFPRVRTIARYYRALLAVPLAVRGRMHGAITLYYRRPHEFSDEDARLAEAFADQTALAIENAQLHAQTVQRSRDLEALYRADEALHRSLRLEEVLQALVDVASDVLESDASTVMVWDEAHERMIAGATRGFQPEVVAQMRYALGEGITGRVAATGESIVVEDTALDERVAHHVTDAEGIRTVLHVPIKVNGQVFGVFGVAYRTLRPLSGDEERVMIAMAHRAAVAIENAQLFAESERQLHELEALYRADETLHRSLRLDDVLEALVQVATDVLRADKSSVYIWDDDQRHLVIAASLGYGPETVAEPLDPGEDLLIDVSRAWPLMSVSDARTDPRLGSERMRNLIRREQLRALMAAPITVSGQLFGLFGVAFCEPHTPSQDEQRVVQALAQRAALAIQNARLFEQAQQVATAEERQRLARELHDAVTQTLFSASLIAEVVPRLWERNPAEGSKRLEELRRLTRGALAEMRTLLLELRPAALVETPFAQLLRQLAEATASRTNLLVDVRTEGVDGTLPAEVQIAMYRIAQEALNNTGKHGHAQRAEIWLRRVDDAVELQLVDDGAGFDQSTIPPGHFGVGIMHERARAIGAMLKVESALGAGTRIDVHWPGVVA
jgi:GAF domain-containing protein